MENNKSVHISEKELDDLLNKVFLNLDFECNSKNKEVLAIVTKQAMCKNSFFTFFNARRFNLLFLLLSLSICLASFYRYIDSSSSKESKKINLAPEAAVTGKETHIVQPSKERFVENSSEHRDKAIPSSSHVTTTHLLKNSSTHQVKKNDQKTVFAASAKKIIIDTTSKFITVDHEIKNTDPLLNNSVIDSLSRVSQNKIVTASPTSKRLEAKSVKKIKPIKPETKTKVAKRRKGNRLFRNGTFKMKNRKYGKSR